MTQFNVTVIPCGTTWHIKVLYTNGTVGLFGGFKTRTEAFRCASVLGEIVGCKVWP
jgi:hypothetical protein